MFEPGETVWLRHLQRGRISLVAPFRALPGGDAVLLWAPAGATAWHFTLPDGRRTGQMPLPEWSAAPRRVPVPHIVDHGVLSWHPLGRDYSIRWFFRPDGTFFRWYANLEAPPALRSDGDPPCLDTTDWDLDVVVEPDRTWRWKDEELFATRLTMPGAYWVDDEDRVRRAGKEVIALAEAGTFPFDGTWRDFRPDPSWPAPPRDLPPGWDRV